MFLKYLIKAEALGWLIDCSRDTKDFTHKQLQNNSKQ